jgi:hypothetical protein
VSGTCDGGEGNEERDVTEPTVSAHFSLGAKRTFDGLEAIFGLLGDDELDCWAERNDAKDGLRDRNGSPEDVVVFICNGRTS